MRQYDQPGGTPVEDPEVTIRHTETHVQYDEDPDTGEIRAEIEQTRNEMGETISAISERLSPQNVKAQATEAVRDATIGRAEHAIDRANERAMGVGAMIWDTIKENPIPSAMAAIGLGWLWMNRTSDKHGSSHGRYGYAQMYPQGYPPTYPQAYSQTYPQAYPQSYQHESNTDGGDTGSSVGRMAGQARDQAGHAIGEAQHRAGQFAGATWHQAESLGGGAMHQAQRARGRFEQMVHDNPLAMGAAAVALGAIVGVSVPETERENQLMGSTRDQLMDRAKEKASDLGEKATRIADEAKKAGQQEAMEQGLKR